MLSVRLFLITAQPWYPRTRSSGKHEMELNGKAGRSSGLSERVDSALKIAPIDDSLDHDPWGIAVVQHPPVADP